MRKVKKGISLVSLIISIIIMTILAGIVTISGISSVKSVALDTFALEILDIQNAVEEYRYKYGKYPVTTDYLFDTRNVEDISQFSEETITDNNINFKLVDLSSIGIRNTKYGNNDTLKDVYVLSEKTGIVYYLTGVSYERKRYYTLTDELYSLLNINDTNKLISEDDVKVYDVIFTPSTTDYTVNPITVTVKLPKTATVNSITTTNGKSISGETISGLYKQIQINETSLDKTGNYKITVEYTYREIEKVSEYEVKNYDNTLPTISYTESVSSDLKTINVTIENNGSNIKTLKYEDEIVSTISYFENYGNNLSNDQFYVDKDAYFTIYVETDKGSKVMVNNLPTLWKPYIVDVVDNVPIPKGFAASPYDGENIKNSGLVIYELDANETEIPRTETHFDSLRERNQYVWVPVDKENFVTEFVRKDYMNTTSKVVNTSGRYNNLGTTDLYWEIEVDENNMPKSKIQLSDYTSDLDLDYITDATIEEAQAMYLSVKEYGGFYVARYETGIDGNKGKGEDDGEIITLVHSKMNKVPYNMIRFTYNNAINQDTKGAVDVARSVYPSTNANYAVVSTLMYGVQWDRILQWWIDTKAKNGTGDVTITSVADLNNNEKYGNYKNNDILLNKFNSGAMYSIENGENYFPVTSDKLERYDINNRSNRSN